MAKQGAVNVAEGRGYSVQGEAKLRVVRVGRHFRHRMHGEVLRLQDAEVSYFSGGHGFL